MDCRQTRCARIISIIGLAFLYWLGSELSRSWASAAQSVSPIWPSDGLAAAAILLFGRWLYPGIWLGSLLANAKAFWAVSDLWGLLASLVRPALIATGTTIGILSGTTLYQRVYKSQRSSEIGKVLSMVGVLSVGAAAINASLGVGALVITGAIESSKLASSWLIWWTSNVGGILLITPFLLSWSEVWRNRRLPEDAANSDSGWLPGLELVGLSSGILMTSYQVFWDDRSLEYLLLPLIGWATIRYGFAGATLSTLLVAWEATVATVAGRGPFQHHGSQQSLLLLQAFLGVLCLTALVLAASRKDQHNTEQQLRLQTQELQAALDSLQLTQDQMQDLNDRLEQEVEDRTTELMQLLDFEALLRRINDKVRDSLDEHQILKTAVLELSAGLGLEGCDTRVFDESQTRCTIVFGVGAYMDYQNLSFLIEEAPQPEVHASLLQSRSCLFCNTYLTLLRGDCRHLSILACPIFDDRGVLGSLWLFKEADKGFSEQEIRLTEQAASQCAIALRQSRLYQTAKAQVKELERLNQLKDDFLSTVSHELRTPIANIRMATKMLELTLHREEYVLPDSDRIERYLTILNKESARENNLINDLLDIARLDSSEALELSEICLPVWVPFVATSYIQQAEERQRQFKLEVPEDLPEFTSDLRYVERIVSELLHNACKYTPSGETIWLSVKPEKGFIRFEVVNSGVEIPAIELERVFDKFYRIPNNDPWKHGGTGLGLALVKKLVEHLQGKIEVKSSDNRVKFVVRLPNLLKSPKPAVVTRSSF